MLPPLFTSACTGLRHFTLIFGFLNIVITLGSGIGMPLSGYIYDAYGGYFLAFALYIVLIIITALAGLAAYRRRPVRAE